MTETLRQKRFRLRKMRLNEISLVPSGDDPTAEVVISKANMPGSARGSAKKLGRKLTPMELKQRVDAAEASARKRRGRGKKSSKARKQRFKSLPTDADTLQAKGVKRRDTARRIAAVNRRAKAKRNLKDKGGDTGPSSNPQSPRPSGPGKDYYDEDAVRLLNARAAVDRSVRSRKARPSNKNTKTRRSGKGPSEPPDPKHGTPGDRDVSPEVLRARQELRARGRGTGTSTRRSRGERGSADISRHTGPAALKRSMSVHAEQKKKHKLDDKSDPELREFIGDKSKSKEAKAAAKDVLTGRMDSDRKRVEEAAAKKKKKPGPYRPRAARPESHWVEEAGMRPRRGPGLFGK